MSSAAAKRPVIALRPRALARLAPFLALLLALFAAPAGAVTGRSDASALWDALRSGGHVALIRHALAPGNGDPPNFTIGDCTTQRNLSDGGRAQAARIGERFRANGINSARVYSSQWCRCLETARLLGLGPVEELPALNSVHRRPERRAPQTRALEEFLAGRTVDSPMVLVSHQSNISAYTNVYPGSGEMVIVRVRPGGKAEVVGTIRTE